jgi:hypothetical protein
MATLHFSIVNADGQNAVYVGSDPKRNVLTLTVTNKSSRALRLKGGDPVAEPPPDNGPTSLYLDFSGLKPRSVAELSITAHTELDSGPAPWSVKYLAQRWVLTAQLGGLLPNEKSVVISVENLVVEGPAQMAPALIGINYYGFDPLDPDSGTAPVLIADPPGSAKPLNVKADFLGDNVAFISTDPKAPIENFPLLFYFANQDAENPIPTKGAQGTGTPEFDITFALETQVPPGPGYGALTTLKEAHDNLVIKMSDTYAGAPWRVKKDTDGATPVWRLYPPAEIFAKGAAVQFEITGLRIPLKPGLTAMYVQYRNIPGCADGYFALEIEKRPPQPSIRFVALTPVQIPFGGSVALSWQSVAVPRLQLSPPAKDFTGPAAAKTASYPVTPDKLGQTTYTLTPLTADGSRLADPQGNPVEAHLITVTMNAPAVVIRSFAPEQAVVAAGSTAKLLWSVDHAGRFHLEQTNPKGPEPRGFQSDINQAAVNNVSQHLNFVLSAYSEDYNEETRSPAPITRETEIWPLPVYLPGRSFVAAGSPGNSEEDQQFTGVVRLDFLADGKIRYRSGARRYSEAPPRYNPVSRTGSYSVNGSTVTVIIDGHPLELSWDNALRGSSYPIPCDGLSRQSIQLPSTYYSEFRAVRERATNLAGNYHLTDHGYNFLADFPPPINVDRVNVVASDSIVTVDSQMTENLALDANGSCRHTISITDRPDQNELRGLFFQAFPNQLDLVEGAAFNNWPWFSDTGTWSVNVDETNAEETIEAKFNQSGTMRLAWDPIGLRMLTPLPPTLTRTCGFKGGPGMRTQTFPRKTTVLVRQ